MNDTPDCPPDEQLQCLLAEQLGPEERAAAEAHVEVCPACQGRLARLAAVTAALPLLPARADRASDPVTAGTFLRRLGEAAPASPVTPPMPAIMAAACPEVPGYEVLRELGRGGMGVVYLARHRRLGRLVALKMIAGAGTHDPDELARFRREAETIAALRHPNVVQIHEVGDADGRPYLALEYVEGGSLARKLAGAPLPAREAAGLVEGVARAMAAAHAQGVVHRDLKPGNVLLAADGTPKVTDFGLAKRLRDEEGLTQSGMLLGTPSYMAPEQASGRARDITPSADVYALGAVLYECLTGRPPFRGETTLETLLQVQHMEPVPPRRLQPKVPRDLETVCLKCLQKEPRKRYASADAAADDLRRFLEGRPVLARPVGAAERLWRWGRRNPRLAAVSAMLLLAIAVGAAGVVWQWQEAVANYHEMEGQYARADAGEKNATAQRTLAEDRERAARRFVYAAWMRQVPDAWERGDLDGVRRYLEAFIPRAGDTEDLRGFEWYYYWRLYHNSRLTLLGHTGQIDFLAFSPDGRLLASAGKDVRVRLWDVRAGKEVANLQPPGNATHLTFSPDGKTLAIAHNYSAVLRWDVATRKRLADMTEGRPLRAAFTPDGKALVVGGFDPSYLWLRDPAGKEMPARLNGHNAPVQWIAFDREGLRMATGDQHGRLLLWDLPDRTSLAEVTAHPGGVNCVALAPDGTALVSQGDNGTIRFWRVEGAPPQLVPAGTLEGDAPPATCLALSPDGKLLATAGADRLVRLWGFPSGKALAVLKGHARQVWALAFSPDGRVLASGGGDQSIKVWEMAAHLGGAARGAARTGRPAGVAAVALAPDGTRLASAGHDGTVRLWDTAAALRGGPPLVVEAHAGRAAGLAFFPDGRTVASAGWDGAVRTWDSATGAALEEATVRARVLALACSPDGRLLASGDERGHVIVRDAPGLAARAAYRLHHGPVASVAFAPDGTRLASAGWDAQAVLYDVPPGKRWLALRSAGEQLSWVGFAPDSRLLFTVCPASVRGWDPDTGRRLSTMQTGAPHYAAAAFLADGKALAAVGSYGGEGRVHLLDRAGPELLLDFKGLYETTGAWARSVAVSSDCRLVVAGSDNGTLTMLDAADGRLLARLPGHARAAHALAWSPDGQTLALAGADFTVRLLEGATGEERAALRGHTEGVLAVAWSPDGTTLASAGLDGTVRLWDAAGRPRRVLRGHTMPVRALAFAPDGRTLAAGGGVIDRPAELKLWDPAGGRARGTLQSPEGGTGHRWMIRALAWSPDGRTLASACGDSWAIPGDVKLWDTATHRVLATLAGHSSALFALAFSADGRAVAAGGHDKTVRLWDVTGPEGTPRARFTLRGHEGPVTSVAFSPDGKTLAAGTLNGPVRLWNPALGQEVGELRAARGVLCLAFAPDGRTLAAGGEDGALWLLRAADPAAVGRTRSAGSTTGEVTDALAAETDRVLAGAHDRLAEALGQTESPDKALAASRDALALLERLHRRFPDDPAVAHDLAVALAALAERVQGGGAAEAERLARRAANVAGGVAAQFPRVDAYQRLQASALRGLGDVCARAGRPHDAEDAYRQAEALSRRLLARGGSPAEDRWGLALALHGLAGVRAAAGRPAEAEQAGRETADHFQTLLADEWSADHYRQRLDAVLVLLFGLQKQARPAEAAQTCLHLISVRRVRAEAAPDNPGPTQAVAEAFDELGMLRMSTQKADAAKAATAYSWAAATWGKLAARDPGRRSYRSGRAASLHGLGEASERVGNPAKAEAAYRDAVGLWRGLLGEAPSDATYQAGLARSQAGLARVLDGRGKTGKTQSPAD